MSDDGGMEDEILKGRWLPLNSRRLNAGHLHLLAETLGLPTGMSNDELRQVIDGKLADMKHDPKNVQVVIQEAARTELHIRLVDESGVFQKCEPVLQDGAIPRIEDLFATLSGGKAFTKLCR